MDSIRPNSQFGRVMPFYFILMLAIVATLSACGGGEPEPATEEAATEEPAAEEPAAEEAETEAPAAAEEGEAAEEPAEEEMTEEEAPAEEAASEEPAEEAPAKEEAEEAAAAPSTDFTGVQGVVMLDGERPRRKAIQMAADPGCEKLHDRPVGTRNALVTSEGQIMYTFVYVKNGEELGDFEAPETAKKLDQIGCLYEPHMLGVMANQPIDIVNSDPLAHNIHGLAKENREFNFGQPTPGTRQHTFRRPEKEIKIKCDIHPWMNAFVFVMEHPFYAVTDNTGSFSIPDLPAGEHTLVAWHETFGELEQTVTIQDGAGAKLDFTFTN